MIGAIIGDLAVSTWEKDHETFYKQLVLNTAVPSPYGIALINAANTFFCPEEKIDTKPIGTPMDDCFFGQWLMWQIAVAWYGEELERHIPQFPGLDKEEFYARMFVRELLKSLLNGSTKGEAYHSCHTFEELSKHWQWRKGEQKLPGADIGFGLLTYVFRAWNAFYLGYDYTSTIHNAVKWSDDTHLTAAIAGAFASAMYGCRFNYIKERYAVDGVIRGELYYHAFNRKEEIQRLSEMMIEKEDSDRKFFKKNCALTNVKKHKWSPSYEDVHKYEFSEEEHYHLIRAWYTDWENRYGFYLDDGWIYFYRSQVLICRFQFHKKQDGKYIIIKLEDGDDKFHNSKEFVEWLLEHKGRIIKV